MPKKCESCRHYQPNSNFPTEFKKSFCGQPDIKREHGYNPFGEHLPNVRIVFISQAREICNKEGDGIFVYFEPKTPAAGAAVQPDDWRKEMHKHMTKAA